MPKKQPPPDLPPIVITVGDEVWIKPPKQPIQKGWRVTEVHVLNRHGYYLSMRVYNWHTGKKRTLSMCSSWFDESKDMHLVFPSNALNLNPPKPHVRLIAEDSDSYAWFCTTCRSVLYLEEQTTEGSTITIGMDGVARQGSPGISDGSSNVRCNCAKDNTYNVEYHEYF